MKSPTTFKLGVEVT